MPYSDTLGCHINRSSPQIEMTIGLSMNHYSYNALDQPELGHSHYAYRRKYELTRTHLLNLFQRDKEHYSFLGIQYLSMPPTRQGLTRGLFYNED